VTFEFDPNKSKSNQQEHGIDFEQAQRLWEDEDRIVFPAKSDTEDRYAIIAESDDKIWVAFYTIRDEQTRIISVRRARKKEKEVYES
jgi:uncharacterized DUF497 family protein